MRAGILTEAVFLHRASRTLVLSDLIDNFERGRGPGGCCGWRCASASAAARRPTCGSPASAGGARCAAAVETMLGWRPDRVVLAHGRPWLRDGTAELRRALAWTGARGYREVAISSVRHRDAHLPGGGSCRSGMATGEREIG